jgi:DNA-binding transcriptional LysR family regulator
MELRHLRYFIAVAEEGHVTRAAERLGIQQPPLSQQIAAIERELQVRLFRRKPRGMELTDSGRAFLDHARSVLARLDQTFETTRRVARGEQGRLCVGVTPTAPFHPFIARVIRAFRDVYPLVSFALEEWHSNELVEYIHAEKLDAAFIRTQPGTSHGLSIQTLMQEDLVVALPKGHPLIRKVGSGEAPVSIKDLSEETFIIQGGQHGLGLFADTIAACRAAGFDPQIGREAPRLASTLNLVAIGLGVSVVPASLQRMKIDGVVYRRLKGPFALRSPMMVASRRGDSSAGVRQFLNFVRQAAKDKAFKSTG